MTAPYVRTDWHRYVDLADKDGFERQVAENLPGYVRTRFDSADDLDLWLPEVWVEVKEKKQRYTARWTDRTNVPEEYLFIIDELTVRRALRHWPNVFFVIGDRPQRRIWLAPLWRMVAVERTRLDRVNKGKWLVDLRNFRQVSLGLLWEEIQADLASREWEESPCVAGAPQV